MIEWRTDKPTEDVIVAQLSSDFCGEERYTILSIATKPYKHYHEDGEEVPLGAIVKWASLKEEPDVNAMQFYHDFVELIGFKDMPVCDDLDKAARKYAGIPEDSPHDLTYCAQDKKAKYAAVLFGANWHKERMMKEAAGKTCCGCAKQKWEYCEKVYSNRGPMNEFEKTQMNYSFPIFRENNLNEMGMEGWEAIHINEGKWTTKVMFKRLKIEENGED